MREASDAGMPIRQNRQSQYDNCELGKRYFMSLGIDYRPDTDDSEDSNIPKEASVRSTLQNHTQRLAKLVGHPVSVKVERWKDNVDGTMIPGLRFSFYQPTQEQLEKRANRKKKGQGTTTTTSGNNTVSESTTNS